MFLLWLFYQKLCDTIISNNAPFGVFYYRGRVIYE